MGIFRRKCPVWSCPLTAGSFGSLLSFGKRVFLFPRPIRRFSVRPLHTRKNGGRQCPENIPCQPYTPKRKENHNINSMRRKAVHSGPYTPKSPSRRSCWRSWNRFVSHWAERRLVRNWFLLSGSSCPRHSAPCTAPFSCWGGRLLLFRKGPVSIKNAGSGKKRPALRLHLTTCTGHDMLYSNLFRSLCPASAAGLKISYHCIYCMVWLFAVTILPTRIRQQLKRMGYPSPARPALCT